MRMTLAKWLGVVGLAMATQACVAGTSGTVAYSTGPGYVAPVATTTTTTVTASTDYVEPEPDGYEVAMAPPAGL